MNVNAIQIQGFVGTDPKRVETVVAKTGEVLVITSFRLGHNSFYFDATDNKMVQGPTQWLTVKGFRTLGENVSRSLSKGDAVIVVGRLKIREWENDSGTHREVEIEAAHIGHDLNLGKSTFERARSASLASVRTNSELPGSGPADSAPAGSSSAGAGGMPPPAGGSESLDASEGKGDPEAKNDSEPDRDSEPSGSPESSDGESSDGDAAQRRDSVLAPF